MKKDRRVSLRKIIKNLNLSEAEDVLESKYKYTPGKPGRPPLPPIGMFLSFTIMFLRMESYRDYHAFLEKGDYSIKKYICDKPMIKEYKKGYLIKDLFGDKSKKNTNWF